MKGKITAVLLILVFLLVVAVVFTFLTSLDRRREAAANAPVSQDVVVRDVTPAPTVEVQTLVTPVPFAAPGQGAAVTSAPVPAATPEPMPTENAVIETPTPVEPPETVTGVSDLGALLASGSFSSNTGKAINIRADYEARVTGANEIGVQVTIYLNSYSIHVNALPDKVNIGLNGQYVTLDSPAIDYDSNTQMLTTELASQSFTVQLPQGNSRDLDLQAEWHWGGTYGGMEIPTIECGGRFTVSR